MNNTDNAAMLRLIADTNNTNNAMQRLTTTSTADTAMQVLEQRLKRFESSIARLTEAVENSHGCLSHSLDELSEEVFQNQWNCSVQNFEIMALLDPDGWQIYTGDGVPRYVRAADWDGVPNLCYET